MTVTKTSQPTEPSVHCLALYGTSAHCWPKALSPEGVWAALVPKTQKMVCYRDNPMRPAQVLAAGMGGRQSVAQGP